MPMPLPAGAPNLRPADVIEVFLANTSRGCSPRALAERRRVLGLFAAECDKPLADCRPLDLIAFLSAHPEWASDWTVRRVIGAVQRPFSWAVKAGVIDRNPFFGVSHPAGAPGRPMTDHEFRRLLRNTTPPFRRVLWFLRWTGCRPGELSAMRWADLDLDQGVIVLREHKTARTRRDRLPRVIVLVPVVVRMLAVLWRRHGGLSRHVFLNARGNPWKRYALACRIKRLRRRLRLPRDCKLYGLRHKYGTNAVVNGVDLKTLAQLMGHTTTRCTEHYVHLAGQTEHLRKAAEAAAKTRLR